MNREEYIFTGAIDSIFYFLIYLFIPSIQISLGFISKIDYTHIIALISMIGLFYDCFTRFDYYNMEKTARRKMVFIGLCAFLMILISIAAVLVKISGLEIPEWYNILYGVFAMPIIFIWLHDTYYVLDAMI